jgi:hypothetical protein
VETIIILQLPYAVKNLGLLAKPKDDTNKRLGEMKTKMENWTVRSKNSNLPIWLLWTSYIHQL